MSTKPLQSSAFIYAYDFFQLFKINMQIQASILENA